MAKSKKKTRRGYSSKDVGTKSDDVLQYNVVDKTDPEKPMIDRKATQAKIDQDKKIKALLDTGAYNVNQIAAMLMIPAAKVKQIKDVS